MKRTAPAILVFALVLAAGSAGREDVAAAQSGGVREPILAGQFYPEDPAQLNAAVRAFLDDAVTAEGAAPPIAIVAPHAGYLYSGQVAADAWRQTAAGSYDTVVILGTNHTTADLRRVALYPGAGFRTPLGIVPVDEALTAALVEEGEAVADAGPHAREHSVEVQLPFLQRLFPKARLVAAIVPAGDAALPVRFGRALARRLHGRRVLVVASSDLSHYPSARDAVAVDRRTLEAMASLDPDRLRSVTAGQSDGRVRELVTCACGEAPVAAAMAAASALGATRARVVSYANSGDLPVGDPEKVVGYGAVAYSAGIRGADTAALDRPQPSSAGAPLPAADRRALLTLARRTIAVYLESGMLPMGRPSSPGLERNQGAFVTLRKKGALRGCIGQMTPAGPLRRVVGAMAFAAAFQDPRFSRVSATELKDLDIEVSILTPFREVPSPLAVVPGRDGVLLRKGSASAVYLPQVATEEGWGREQLLDNLCAKAGLDRGCWQGPGARLSTFQAEVFAESESRR